MIRAAIFDSVSGKVINWSHSNQKSSTAKSLTPPPKRGGAGSFGNSWQAAAAVYLGDGFLPQIHVCKRVKVYFCGPVPISAAQVYKKSNNDAVQLMIAFFGLCGSGFSIQHFQDGLQLVNDTNQHIEVDQSCYTQNLTWIFLAFSEATDQCDFFELKYLWKRADLAAADKDKRRGGTGETGIKYKKKRAKTSKTNWPLAAEKKCCWGDKTLHL